LLDATFFSPIEKKEIDMPVISSKGPLAGRQRDTNPQKLAQALGWYSLALGAAELLAPRSVARASGVRTSATVVRLYGLREIACGIGILTSRDPSPFLWARIGGDAVDLLTLLSDSDRNRNDTRQRAMGALLNVTGVTALDVHAATSMSNSKREQADAQQRTAQFVSMYSTRSGFPRSPDEMRGAARESHG
jgi:hypothetical protein